MIVDGAYPNDIRVRKEAESLAENGKNVLVVCPRKKNDSQSEIINNVTVFRIGNNYTNSKKGIYDIIESVTNINLLFYKGLKLLFQKYEIEYLHVHDLPLAGTGYLFKSRVKHIYLDLHENFPEALKTWFLWKQNKLIQLKNSLFMNPKLWSKKEEKYCKKYDKVICVVEEMKTKLITNFSIDTKKLIVVSNHEKKEFTENFKHAVAQNIINKNDFSITYVGGFGPHRGLQTAIEAMPKIVEKIPDAKLFLIGKGSVDVENTLKELVAKYNLTKSVIFVGYRPFEEVSTIMQQTNVNIIPHLANAHTDNTIPHKLFQIMMSKSLLLVSSCKPLQRIVTKYDAGLVFKADDAEDFSEKVIDIRQNYDQYQIKTENAFNAVMHKDENWEAESAKILSLYTE
ncbi:Glycosyl transferase group 1 [Polaribacter dokdonensis DSW-5]|nr:Glycosyl transferase group 1 [Polaribacter dokdonensis DSW-5]